MYKVGENYSVNYKAETSSKDLICFYLHITRVTLTHIDYIISEVFSDTDSELLKSFMDNDLECQWTIKQFEATSPLRVRIEELKYNLRCPKCALLGYKHKTAYLCRRHGVFAGF